MYNNLDGGMMIEWTEAAERSTRNKPHSNVKPDGLTRGKQVVETLRVELELNKDLVGLSSF